MHALHALDLGLYRVTHRMLRSADCIDGRKSRASRKPTTPDLGLSCLGISNSESRAVEESLSYDESIASDGTQSDGNPDGTATVNHRQE